MGALLLLAIIIGGAWFFSQFRREYRRGKAEDDLKEALSNVRFTISTGPFPDDAEREGQKKGHQARRVVDAYHLIVAGTSIPQTLHADLLDAIRLEDHRADRLAEVLGDSQWSWPWFEFYFEQFRGRKIQVDDWDEWEPRPTTPTSFEDILAALQPVEMREVVRGKGMLPKPAPKTRADCEALVRKTCTVEELAAHFAGSLKEEQEEWDEDFKDRKAGFLIQTVFALRDSLMVLDEARESDPEPDPGFPEWKQQRSKIVAGSPLNRLSARFNRGDLPTIPPYFPGDVTEIETMPHNMSPRTGRFVNSIPGVPWEPVMLDLKERAPADS